MNDAKTRLADRGKLTESASQTDLLATGASRVDGPGVFRDGIPPIILEKIRTSLVLLRLSWVEMDHRSRVGNVSRSGGFGERKFRGNILSITNNLSVPWGFTQGSRFAYLMNRKAQIHYFMSANTNLPACEKAGTDFKNELAEYRRQLASGDPALLKYRQQVLVINLKSGKSVRLPVAALPPPLNRGSLPPGYIERILELNLEDSNTIIDALWSYHKQTALEWMGEALLLPSW